MAYFFDTKESAATYIKRKLGKITPIKLHKVMYLLYAFYSATYGNLDINQSELKDSNSSYPDELFKADFVALSTGAVVDDVKAEQDTYKILASEEITKEIEIFIDGILQQVKEVDDYSLILRLQQDKSWQNAFEKGKRNKISKTDIKAEYIEIVKSN